MRKVYCYAEKEEKPEEIDHSGDIVQDLSSLDISDIKNRRFFFIGGEIIGNPYYEPSEYMKRVYAAIDAQYEKFYRSDKDKKDSEEKDDVKDAEEETNEQSSDDEMPDWIAEMPYGELIKKFPGGISEALEYAKKEKGLSVPEVHYDSPEPEKLGVKAFTKNAEVYLAPGEGEETLKHELGHVIQQKKEKIPATTKIGEQQVNLDPKLEQEADEIAKHIEDHIPEIISNKSTNTETKDVIQLDYKELIARIDDELKDEIKEVAYSLSIPENIMDDEKVNSILYKLLNADEFAWSELDPYMFLAYALVAKDSKKERDKEYYLNFKKSLKELLEQDAECGIYLSLSEYRDRVGDRADDERKESERITEIMDMLSTEKIFPTDTNSSVTLHTIMSWLVPEQCEEIKKCILKLKNYCDSEGVKSVLESADVNSIIHKKRVLLQDPKNNMHSEDAIQNMAAVFINRLKLMTAYIERVAEKFGDKYWIRSTGSDPHKNGEHALFLIPKTSEPIDSTLPPEKCEELRKYPLGTRVYKPHDMSSDRLVVGNDGIFTYINKRIQDEFIRACEEKRLTPEPTSYALATIEICADTHTEEFIRKTGRMSSQEAQLYFFRAGILKAITDAMAVIDLHRDNIMPTMCGPVISDAEVDFFRYSNSGLDFDALSMDNRTDVASILSNSTFTVVEDRREIPSGKAFQEPTYRQKFDAGYLFMIREMHKHLNSFAQEYERQLQSVRIVRIVPIRTGNLALFLHEILTSHLTPESRNEHSRHLLTDIRSTLTKPKLSRGEVAKLQLAHKGLSQNIADSLKGKEKIEGSDAQILGQLSQQREQIDKRLEDSGDAYIFSYEAQNLKIIFLEERSLLDAIEKTHQNGTIIAFYVAMEDGTIYLDETPIAYITTTSGQRVNKKRLIEVMVSEFRDTITNLFENNKLDDSDH